MPCRNCEISVTVFSVSLKKSDKPPKGKLDCDHGRQKVEGKKVGMETRSYSAGEIIVAEGTHGDQTFLITAGSVQICKETGKGRITIATLSEGEVFGEMYLLEETGFRTASVIATTAVTVEVIPREEMEQQLAGTPSIVLSMMKTLSTRLAQTSQENSLLKFQVSSPLKKIARRLGL